MMALWLINAAERLRGIGLLGLAILSGYALQAGAQTTVAVAREQDNPLKGLSLEKLGEIEVTTTSKQPEQVWRTASAIYVITQEDIRRSGAATVPDALRLAPGVIVNQNDSNRWAVGIRGFGDILSKNVLVLIDGRNVYSPLQGGVFWAIEDVLLSNIERIEVIRGPGGTVWGTNAVNGVINIIRRNARETHGTRVALIAGNVEMGRASFRYGSSIGDKLDYRVQGKWFTRAPGFHRDDANFDDWRSGLGGFRADWTPTTRDQVTFSGDIYKTKTGERAIVSYFIPPSIQITDAALHLTGGNLLGAWARQFSGGARFQLQGYYDRTSRKSLFFDEVRNTFDFDANHRLAPWRRNELYLGAQMRVSPSRVRQTIPSLNFIPNERTHRLYSLFIQDQLQLAENLALTVGSKFEHNSYSGWEYMPSARVLWTPGSHQSLWAAVTRAVRTPSRFDRDISLQVLIDPATPLYASIIGSPDFKPETLLGYEAGYRKLVTTDFYVDFAAFYNGYDRIFGFGNAFISAQTSPIAHLRLNLPFANEIEGSTRGFEITPDWKPLRDWNLKGSYSYLRFFLGTKPGFTDRSQVTNYSGSSPRHQVKIQSRIDLPGNLQFDQTYRYSSELPAQMIREYHTIDARLSWQFSDHVEFSVAGQNLLQPHHVEFGGGPSQVGIRRSAYGQVVIRR